jgi:hypothetical protein
MPVTEGTTDAARPRDLCAAQGGAQPCKGAQQVPTTCMRATSHKATSSATTTPCHKAGMSVQVLPPGSFVILCLGCHEPCQCSAYFVVDVVTTHGHHTLKMSFPFRPSSLPLVLRTHLVARMYRGKDTASTHAVLNEQATNNVRTHACHPPRARAFAGSLGASVDVPTLCRHPAPLRARRISLAVRAYNDGAARVPRLVSFPRCE